MCVYMDVYVKTLLPEPRPWAIMADPAGFRKPLNYDEARTKLVACASAFRINYMYVVAASALFGLVFNFYAFLLTLAAAACAAFLVSDTHTVGVIVLRGITVQQRHIGACGICAMTVLLSGAVGAAASGACIGAAACALHGVCYEPPPDFA